MVSELELTVARDRRKTTEVQDTGSVREGQCHRVDRRQAVWGESCCGELSGGGTRGQSVEDAQCCINEQ